MYKVSRNAEARDMKLSVEPWNSAEYLRLGKRTLAKDLFYQVETPNPQNDANAISVRRGESVLCRRFRPAHWVKGPTERAH
jgi:hypothetical protein